MKSIFQNHGEEAVEVPRLRASGGPGSGWFAEAGHVPEGGPSGLSKRAELFKGMTPHASKLELDSKRMVTWHKLVSPTNRLHSDSYGQVFREGPNYTKEHVGTILGRKR